MKALTRWFALALIAMNTFPALAQSSPRVVTLTVETGDPFAAVNSAAWSPDGTQVLATVGDGTVRVWDAASGAEVLQLAVAGRAWWNADGSGVITHDIIDDEAVLWRVADGSRAYTAPHTVPLDLPSPDRRLLVTVDGTTVTVRDAATGEVQHTLDGVPLNYYWLDENTLAAVDQGTYQVWDAAAGLRESDFAVDGFVADATLGRLLTVEQGPEVTRLRLYDLRRGIGTRAYRVSGSVVQSQLAPAADTLYVVAQPDPESGMQLIVWDITEGDPLLLPVSGDPPRSIVYFTPNSDGSRIITISSAIDAETSVIETGSEQVVVWDAATGERLLEVSEAEVVDGAWSPDEMQVAVWGSDGGLLWDIETGEVVLRFSSDDFVRGAAFDADGERLLVWGNTRLQIFLLN